MLILSSLMFRILSKIIYHTMHGTVTHKGVFKRQTKANIFLNGKGHGHVYCNLEVNVFHSINRFDETHTLQLGSLYSIVQSVITIVINSNLNLCEVHLRYY